MTDLVILVPMLGRAHRVVPLLESIRATCDARVLFCLTPGDTAVLRAVEAARGHCIMVGPEKVGDYARKINRGIAFTAEPYIFTGADDLNFHPRWYEAARAAMAPGIGVVGTNDLANQRGGEHATHLLVARWYVEQHGTIDESGKFFHEGYPHEWVDDEAVGTAKRRGMWAYATDSIVEHLHPMVGKAPMDSLYSAQRARMRRGAALYQRRRRLWR